MRLLVAGLLLGQWAAAGAGWEAVAGSEVIADALDMVQTADGHMWFAAGSQIYRYDGRRFEAFGEAHGLESRGLLLLGAEPGGTLLVRTTEGLFRLEEERFRKIWTGRIGHFAVRPDGLIALGTYEGRLVVGHEGKWNAFSRDFRTTGQVNFDRDGVLRFGCGAAICEIGREALHHWDSLTGRDVTATDPKVLPGYGMAILGLARDRWGRVWIRDWQRMFVAGSGGGPFREVPVENAATGNSPILRLSPGGVVYFNSRNGLVWGNAKGALEVVREAGGNENGGSYLAYWDRQGLIWVSRRGAGMLRREARELLTRSWGVAEGLKDQAYGFHQWNGKMLAGTMGGVYALRADERGWDPLPETMEKFGGLPALATARDGALLIGVNRGPPILARMEKSGRVSRTYAVPPYTNGPNVYSMMRDPKGFLWVGTSRRLYRAVESGPEIAVTPVPLGVRDVGANLFGMMLDERQRLVLPTSYGLLRVDGDKVERWTEQHGLPFQRVRGIGRDARGGYWLGFLDVPGVVRVEIEGGKLRVDRPGADVAIGSVSDILTDRRGWIWISDDKATWVNRTGDMGVAAFQRVGEDVPALAKGANMMSLHEDEAGRIWGASAAGVVRIEDPERFVDEDLEPPPVTVTGLQFRGVEGEALRAHLQAPWLRGMDQVRFRWRLGGETWQVSGNGELKVDRVPAGTWNLEAQAEHVDGKWRSKVVNQQVISVVPWWRATWFWYLAGTGVMGVFGFVWGRRRKAREAAAAYAARKLSFLEKQAAIPLFGDRYRGISVIGRGAFATVYRAEDEAGGKDVAVKVLAGEGLARRQLEREVESLRRISHPGVVGVVDYSIDEEGRAYLVLEYVPGPTLREVLRKGALERNRVARLARQLGEALGAAHAAGVIHRDLKPENIILRPEGEGERAVIVDFGIAVCKPPGMTSAQATSVGGTVFYLAPEQLAGTARPSADVYSLGVILCEALTGTCPSMRDDEGLDKRAEAAAELLAGDASTELICEAMAYDPGKRPKDAAAFGAAVAARLN
jgi:hypothetical protein